MATLLSSCKQCQGEQLSGWQGQPLSRAFVYKLQPGGVSHPTAAMCPLSLSLSFTLSLPLFYPAAAQCSSTRSAAVRISQNLNRIDFIQSPEVEFLIRTQTAFVKVVKFVQAL